jgi:hypothetical protein
MYKYQLSGKIHPERVDFTIGTKLPLCIEHGEFGIKGKVVLEIRNSNITISFDSQTEYSSSDTGSLETLKNILEESVRMIVDAYGYVRSYAYEVEITNIKNLDSSLNYQFGVRGEWNILKDDESVDKEFSRILGLFTVPENAAIGDVLADFRRAIKYPSMTASFCFRAIETIRQHTFEDVSITNDDKRREDAWIKLRANLGFKKEDFDEIKTFALPNRHGKYPKITYQERERLMNFTRVIIDKVIQSLQK